MIHMGPRDTYACGCRSGAIIFCHYANKMIMLPYFFYLTNVVEAVARCRCTSANCYGYIDFSLHFLLLSFLLSFYHLFISLKSKSPFSIAAIHFPQSWELFY